MKSEDYTGSGSVKSPCWYSIELSSSPSHAWVDRTGIEAWIAEDYTLHSYRSSYVVVCLGDGMLHELLVRARLPLLGAVADRIEASKSTKKVRGNVI